MITITTTVNLKTEKERIEHIKESSHLMELVEDIVLECPDGKYSYNFLNDLFAIGEQKTIEVENVKNDIVKIGEDEFEIHDMSNTWVSTVVNIKTLKELIHKEISFLDLEWH